MLKIQFRDGRSEAVRPEPPGITIGKGNVMMLALMNKKLMDFTQISKLKPIK